MDSRTPLKKCPVCKAMVESTVHCKICNAHMEPEFYYKNQPAPAPLPTAPVSLESPEVTHFVIRQRDDGPQEVYRFTSLHDAHEFYTKASAQWSQCFLVRRLDNEPTPAPQPEAHIPLIMHPGYGRMQPVTAVLDDLASQENCDGEPYDQMIQASQIIVSLSRRVAELEAELRKTQNLLACATCFFRPTPRGTCRYVSECCYSTGVGYSSGKNCWESMTPLELLTEEDGDGSY